MNNEFKKITNKNETRYILETTTSGVVSTGAIATTSSKIGELRRRLQELKDKISVPTTKPRNPIGMGANPGRGTQTHANKKRDQKIGKEKHKKPFVDENNEPDHEISMASNELTSIAADAANLLDIVKQRSEEEGLEAWQQSKITKAADYMNSVLQSIRGDEEQGVAEGYSELDNLKARFEKTIAAVIARAEAEGRPLNDREKKFIAILKGEQHGVSEGDLNEYELYRRADGKYVDDEGNVMSSLPPGRGRHVVGSAYRGGSSRPSYPSKPKGMYFYNVRPGQENDAVTAGLKQSKSGKWYSTVQSSTAEKMFGAGRYWEPKNEGMAEEIGYDEITPKSASYILRKMEQGVPMSSILDDFPELGRRMEIIAGELGLHMDDDFEDIEASLYHELEDLAASGEDEMGEGLRDPKDNPCWKGYKPVGTKKKGGRTVPNCVPTNEDAYINQLMAALESKK